MCVASQGSFIHTYSIYSVSRFKNDCDVDGTCTLRKNALFLVAHQKARTAVYLFYLYK